MMTSSGSSASAPSPSLLSVTGTGTVTSPDGDRNRSPDRPMASACRPRATTRTSAPDSKRRAPMTPPIAPAPRTVYLTAGIRRRSAGLVADDGHALHDARGRPVVAHRVVLGAAVVPEGERIG